MPSTFICEQSETLESEESLQTALKAERLRLGSSPIPMPINWGGYVVEPNTIEFLTFKNDRLHRREKVTRNTKRWEFSLLQP